MNLLLINPREEVIKSALQAGSTPIVILSCDSEKDFITKYGIQLIHCDNTLDPLVITRAIINVGIKPCDANTVCIGFGDDTSQVASLVNSSMNFANGKYSHVFELELMRNKPLFRSLVNKNLAYLSGNFKVISVKSQLLETFIDFGNKGVVAKPLYGSGSKNVQRFDNISKLQNSLDSLSFPLLVEEVFHGKEYSVETLSWDGKHYPIIVTEKVTGGVSGLVEIAQKQPASISYKQKEALFTAASNILNLVGYKFGLSHIEFMINEESVKVIEAHGRVGGDRIANLMGYSTGMNAFERLFRTYENDSVDEIKYTSKEASIHFVELTDEKVQDTDWLKTILSKNDVVDAQILLPKEKRGSILSSKDRHAFYICISDSEEN